MGYEEGRAEICLQHIVNTVAKATLASAETHRLSVESNLRNALLYGEYDPSQTARLKRLVQTVEQAISETSIRKLQILQDTVVPTLTTMGLAEEI